MVYQMAKEVSTTKISRKNLARIKKLKISGYEPNDYIISLALDALEEKIKLQEEEHEKKKDIS